jgi:hypothetical protein
MPRDALPSETITPQQAILVLDELPEEKINKKLPTCGVLPKSYSASPNELTRNYSAGEINFSKQSSHGSQQKPNSLDPQNVFGKMDHFLELSSQKKYARSKFATAIVPPPKLEASA